MTAPDQQNPDPEPHAGQGKTPDTVEARRNSAQAPAEGGDDVNPPTEGSPRG